MFIYEVIGFSYISQKGLFVLHLTVDRVGVKGKAVETVFVNEQFIEGGKIDVGSIVKIYRDARGFTQGVEVV